MNNKKILLSFLLVVLIALSLSAVSAQDAADDVVAADDSDIDVVAADDSADVLSDTYKPTGNDAAAVQDAINKANKSGDIVDLSNYSSYDFKNNTVEVKNSNIIIQGNIETTINGTGDNDGILYINGASNITIRGIQFVNTNPNNNLTYKGSVNGIALKVMGAKSITIEDCEFYNFNQDIRVQRTNNVLIQNNGFYGGIATKIINDPTVNEETGTKALNIMGSTGLTIFNNTFGGPVLDAISIASGSGSNKVINNTIVGAAYAIYFGGASTKGSTIKNNEFINCGSFKEDNMNLEGLPVISIQKASDSISIVDNTFKIIDNNILIAAEKGNEAHGAPTSIGDINVTGNTLEKYNATVNASTVTLFHVLARTSSLEISAPLNVTENTFPNGVKGISIWMNDNEIYSAENAYIENGLYNTSTMFNTTISVSDVNITEGDSANLKISLVSNGVGLINKVVLVMIDGKAINAVTDVKGVALVPINSTTAGIKYVTAVFLGEGSLYQGAVASAKITINAKPTPVPPATKKATTLAAKKATLKVKKAKKIKVTLKSEGKAVAGKTVTIKVNKKTFKGKTNAKGVATIKVKVTKKGKFNAVVNFAGDNDYNAATKKVQLTVKK